MKYRYGKFIPDLLDELDMDELMSKVSDLLMSSGFRDPYFHGDDDDRSMQALYDAILEALLSGDVLPDERLRELLGDDADEESRRAT
jgi:Ca-activated chloride channel homolog